MKIIPFNSDTLDEIITTLKNGGVIAHPADTCYGLAGDLLNPQALKKIQAIKSRNYNKPMSIMISVAGQFKMDKYVTRDDFSSFITYKLFPGAITIVLPKGPEIPEYYFPEIPTIGLRVPLHNITQDILAAFKKPLITTSANLSGSDICFSHEDVIECFKNNKNKPDLIIEGKNEYYNLASTVIKTEKNYIQIIRKGPVTKAQLESILGVDVKG